MQKGLVFLLIILLMGLGGAQAQSPDTPADLLPSGTLVYIEVPAGNLPSDIDTLIRLLAPPGMLGSAHSLLANTPFTEDWMGERAAIGVFSTFDVQSSSLRDAIPTAAIIIEVVDDEAVDAYLQNNLGDQWRSDDDLHTWTGAGDFLTLQILRVPGFIVLGTARAITAIGEQLQSPGYTSLAEQASFASLREALSPDPVAWMVIPSLGSGVAFHASESALSIETLYYGVPPAEVPAALNPGALEGVPINAIFVDAGMNADFALRSSLNTIRALLLLASQVDEQLATLPFEFEFGMQNFLGVSMDQELIPLFDGGYAFYVARNPGASDVLPVGVEGGLILAPQNAANAPDILARLMSQLAESVSLPIEQSGGDQYMLPVGGLFSVVTGIMDERLYFSDENGAQSIQIALDDGPNILESPRWSRALEAAPPGAQHVMYLNARELLDLVIVTLQTNPNLPQANLTQAITYAKRFESAAIFQRGDANGVHLTRFVLLFN